MKTVRQSVLIWYSPHEMFELVRAFERYPEFLPWCDHAKLLSDNASGTVAEMGIAFAGIKQRFTTHNAQVADSEIRMGLVQGPFSQLTGTWTFSPVGEGTQRACRVELVMQYAFGNRVLASLVGPVFDRIAATLVDAFVERANKVYG